MSRSIVGLISAPDGTQHVLVYGDEVLSIFMEAFAPAPCPAPLVSDIDDWMSAHNQLGTETASIVPAVPMPVAVFVQYVKVNGVPRVRPELRGMAQEPWSSVLRAMQVKLRGGPSALPTGYTFQPAATVVLTREHADC